MKKRSKPAIIKKWHMFVSVGVISTLFIFGGYLYYSSEEKSIRNEKFQEIQAVAELKINQIIQWRKERLEDATIAMQAPFFSREVEQWFGNRKDLSLKKDILKRFTEFKINYDYEDIFLVSLQGEILLSFDSKEEIFSTITSSIIQEVIKRQQITFTDFYYCPTHKKIHYDIIAPVIDDKNISIAVLLFRIDPDDYLYPLIQTWPTPSKTAETLLLRRDGDSVLFLNELRHWKNTALKLRIPLTQKEVPAVQAALGYKGIWEGLDYRGVKVLSDVQSIPGTPWFMVAKVDKSEIYSELTFRAVFISIFILVLILLSGAGLALIYSSRQRNIYRELFIKEKELREAHEEFKTILYSIGDGVITTDKNGFVKQMNSIAKQLTGWGEAEAKGKLLEDVFHIVSEETKNKVENPVKRVLREGLIVGLANHTLLISRDGNEIPIADSGAPIKNELNEITGVVLVFSDKTKERESLNALEESERLLKESQSIAHLGSYVFDLSKGFWSSSKILDDIFGIDENYIRSLEGWTALLHPDWNAIMIKYLAEEVIEKRRKFDKEYKIIRKADGKERWVHGLGVLEFDKNDQPIKLIGTIIDITERKRMEEVLYEQQQVFRTLVENSPDIIARYDRNCQRTYINPAYLKTAQISQQELLASSPTQRSPLPAASAAVLQNLLRKVLDSGIGEAVDVIWPKADNIDYWYNIYASPEFDLDGRIVSVMTVSRDITKRKQAEDALRKASSYNRRLIEASIDPLVTIGADGKITDVNKATETVTGTPRERLIGDDFSNYFTEPEKAKEGYKKMLAEGLVRDYPLTIRHTLGKTTDVLYNATVYKNEKGEIQGVFAAARDITELKRVEETRKFAEIRLNDAQKIAHIGSWELDLVNNNLIWSDEIYRIFEIDREKFGASYDAFLDAIHSEDREAVNSAYTNSVKNKTPYSIDHRLLFPDGRTKFVYEECRTFYDDNDNPIRSVGTVQDITERKRAEEKIKKLNQELEQRVIERTAQLESANKELEAFSYSVSHDLRAPLRGIDGFSNILLEDYSDKLDKEGQRLLNVIRNNTQKMGHLIDDLLAFSKISRRELDKSEIDMKTLTNSIYHEVTSEQEREKILFSVSDLPHAKGDAAMIRQLWTNLLSNAVKFSSKKEKPVIEIGGKVESGKNVYCIRDNGVGFDMKYYDKLFGVFQRLHSEDEYPGTGVGLAIAKRIVTKHGGEIRAESEINVGTTFYFSV